MAEVTGMTPAKITQEINNVKSYVDGGLSQKADITYVDQKEWVRGNIPNNTQSLDELKDGSWGVSYNAVRTALGLSTDSWGNILLQTWGVESSSRIAIYTDVGTDTRGPKMWVNHKRGGVWSGWSDVAKLYDDEKWYRPALGTGDTLDDKTGTRSAGIYPVTSTVEGIPYPAAGWVTVTFNATTQITRQVYQGAIPSVTSTWDRVRIHGVWQEWVVHWSGDRLNRAIQEIQERTWLYPERLTSQNDIDLLVNEDDQHMYMCSSAVVGLPAKMAGWLTVYHERVSKQAMQVYMPSSSNVAGHWTRKYNGTAWGEWERFDPRSSSGGGNDRDTLVRLGHAATPWETAKLVASYEQGELYLDQVAAQVPFVSKETIGNSSGGNPISGLLLGDAGKPIVYIDCATHGDEVSSREAMLIWLKMVASRRARWMDHVAAFVVPTLNVDRINVHRRTINNVDMNRDYVDQSTPEVQSNVAAVQAKDPIFYACCHEYRTDNRGDIGILMQPTNQSWLPDETVKSVSGRIYNEIRQRLTSEGIDSGPYPQSFNSDTPPVQAHYYMSSVLNIPSMLIEAPGILESLSNSGNYPSPRRYVPNLEKRIHDYMIVLDQVMESAAVIAQERAEN